MSRVLVILGMFLLTSCGQSQEEKINIAAVTCSIMGETRNMDAAVRVREMNNAREKIGGEPFLRGDDTIKESFEWGLCQELVLNQNYDETLQSLKDAKRERERIAAEKQRIADSKPTVKEEFYSNGKLKSRINYQSKSDGGEKHGLQETYHDNGQLERKGNIKDGQQDGLWEQYYENGQLQYKENWKDGKEEGLREGYYDNGQLRSEVNYKNGVMVGLSVNYYKDGALLGNFCFKNGEKTDMSYCEE
jgi:antitoxin component YwqK of YwqJK toxin-antitoxin module